jgi:D-alanyl-D-alanine-carboxypeptidase/D-alanyl-D-alanine-endopeptidase
VSQARTVRRLAAAAALLPTIAVSSLPARSFQVPDDVRASARARVDGGWSVGIVVGVVDSSGARFFSYGRTALAGGAPVDERTVYEIGSVTKVFTALSLADMVVKGEAGLDDPVQRYLPDSVVVPRRDSLQITLRLLSAQRSGLPRLPGNFAPANPANPYADYDAGRLYAFLNGYTLTRNPGARYEYSNLGVGLLGLALSRRNGASYERMVAQRVIGPLGLTSTGVTLTPDMRSRLAHGHQDQSEKPNWEFDALAGAGALRSTAADLARFLGAAMGLVRTPLDSAFRLTEAVQADAGPTMRIGLGWHFIGGDTATIIWHNGGTGGYHSFIGFDPRRRVGVVVLSNSSQSIDDLGFHALNPSRALAPVRAAIRLPAESLAAYAGEYQIAPGIALTVRQTGDTLLAQLTGQGAYPIYPEARGEFFFRIVDAQISFVRDSTGAVASLVLHQNGQNIPAKRKP